MSKPKTKAKKATTVSPRRLKQLVKHGKASQAETRHIAKTILRLDQTIGFLHAKLYKERVVDVLRVTKRTVDDRFHNEKRIIIRAQKVRMRVIGIESEDQPLEIQCAMDRRLADHMKAIDVMQAEERMVREAGSQLGVYMVRELPFEKDDDGMRHTVFPI